MMNGRNNGKKLMAVRIVAHCFEIVRLPRPPTALNPRRPY
jgi:ribosomal protein S7